MTKPRRERPQTEHRSPTAVAVDLEAITANAQLLISRYTHAVDFAYRGATSSIIRLPEPGRGIDKGGAMPGPTPGLALDQPWKELARSKVHDADEAICDALASLREAQTALNRIYFGKKGSRPQVEQSTQLRKGPYYVQAQEAQQRRQERGEE